MTTTPTWLVERFAERGGGTPTLLRAVTSPVWSDGTHLVAKLHRSVDEGRREAEAASRAVAAGVPAATCLGVDPHSGGVLTWWRHVPIVGPAAPADAARWLRQLHDRADSSRLPPAQLTAATRPPLRGTGALTGRLAPWVAAAAQVRSELLTLPRPVLVHGDANPTNLVRDTTGTTGLDFGCAGLGPRVFDVATVAVLATETGAGTVAEVLDAYGPHEDVTDHLVARASQLVAVLRAEVCTWVPGWIPEGLERVDALEQRRPYRFAEGNGPK